VNGNYFLNISIINKGELPGPKFSPVDEIWLFLKSIFEEKSHTISKNGIIKEDDKK
jgi:hypothetical protein